MENNTGVLPSHIAIIMDGNRRWAKEHNLNVSEGHKKGAEALREISECIYDKGVEVLSVYAFSTENWKRPKEEIDVIMDLFRELIPIALILSVGIGFFGSFFTTRKHLRV